ncbi:periplasmic heavy metal sensor [Oceanicella actignis]|uniref:periplasmic heavy metal sensor n=1 Tax=Oceanicella actignis TaxID=1189325 RepID=UPI0011E77D8E|nr:periplasmic heavy metal sensor [Oceanicella actignis]TYO91662.1 putative membrane protein [Oceanicella actignis]
MAQDKHDLDPTEAPRGEAPAPPARRWGPARWALAASLCLNLLFIGAAAGLALRLHGHPHDQAAPAGFDRFTLRRVMRMMPEDERARAHELMRAHRDELRAARDRRDAARAQLARALAAEPFSADALRAALRAAREAERSMRDVADDAFVAFAATLSPEARRRIAEELRRPPPHSGPRPRADRE